MSFIVFSLWFVQFQPVLQVWSQFGGCSELGNPANFSISKPTHDPLPEWKRSIGPGRGGIVTDGQSIFVSYAKPKPDSKGKAGEEVVACLDLKTGKTKWEESFAVEMLPTQQYFGGAPIQPQATPCVFKTIVFTVGFTGLLHARDTATGKMIWQKDLVADFGAKPVQFGFAASPVVYQGQLYIHTGGQHAVVKLNPANGQTIWKSEAAGASYATPNFCSLDSRRNVLIQMTQNAFMGLDPITGKTLWKYDLPKQGLTNVPMPIPVRLFPGLGFLLSGQGCEGTRLLIVNSDQDQFMLKEKWHQKKVQFFYSTFATDQNVVYGFSGNTGSRFAAINLTDGSVITQELGQREANCVLMGESLLLLRGDGVLTRCNLTKDGFENTLVAKPLSGRCWAPPMVHQGSVFIRSDTEIASVALSSLKAEFKLPPDGGRTAMDEAFGGGGKK